MKYLLNINQSLDAIRANLFRAGITIFIIALGITALIIVMTSIEGIKYGMSNSFSALGSNTFRIQNRSFEIRFGHRGRRSNRKRNPNISYREALDFQEKFGNLAVVSASVYGSGSAKAKYKSETTNNNIGLIGTDQNYLTTSRYVLEEGRGLTEEDVTLGRNVVVIGHEIREKLFRFGSPLGEPININSHIYKVIGVFEKMGTMGMSGGDRTAIIPITTLRNHYPNHGSLTLNVYVENTKEMPVMMEEAKGVFRTSRKLKVKEENDFALSSSDEFINQLFDRLSFITGTAQIIALITLLGAAVALLNVMLVSVTERTSEIGLRKAMGATRSNILRQFLIEAIVICQLGGLLGILIGIMGGNLVTSFLFEGSFVVPWGWVITGITACLIVGVAAGYYPAWKAARVDPIESLRHE